MTARTGIQVEKSRQRTSPGARLIGLFHPLPEEAPSARPSSNFYSFAAIVERANSTNSAARWKRMGEPNQTCPCMEAVRCHICARHYQLEILNNVGSVSVQTLR